MKIIITKDSDGTFSVQRLIQPEEAQAWLDCKHDRLVQSGGLKSRTAVLATVRILLKEAEEPDLLKEAEEPDLCPECGAGVSDCATFGCGTE